MEIWFFYLKRPSYATKLLFLDILDFVYWGSVWIQLKMTFAFCNLRFSLFFFFLLFFGLACNSWLVNCEQCTVHYSWVLQIILFNNFFIKNTFHNIIYTFKNYFATVFSISVKISLIQTDPKKYWIFLIVLYVIYLFF